MLRTRPIFRSWTSEFRSRAWQTQTMDLECIQTLFSFMPAKAKRHGSWILRLDRELSASFQFIFPRQVGGKPLPTEQDKSLTLEFTYPPWG